MQQVEIAVKLKREIHCRGFDLHYVLYQGNFFKNLAIVNIVL